MSHDQTPPTDGHDASAAGRRRAGRSIHVGTFAHDNPVPAASRVGPFVFSGAVTGRDPRTRQLPPDLDRQCAHVFEHVRLIAQAAGARTDDIVKITVYLREFRDRTALNREWEQMFPDPDDRPARQVLPAALDGDMLIQCDFVAVVGEHEVP